jgi:hypothetical protein
MAEMQPSSPPSAAASAVVPFDPRCYHLAAENDPDGDPFKRAPVDRQTAGREDLPYRVELWDEAKKAVEQVLAVTVNAGIGYAAYYAATREHPQRYITLRHKNAIVSRWNGAEQ